MYMIQNLCQIEYIRNQIGYSKNHLNEFNSLQYRMKIQRAMFKTPCVFKLRFGNHQHAIP